jgi:uncharacterized protein
MAIRFLCDSNLGKLSKWLRILGYDTLFDRGETDWCFIRKADRDGRIALTRKKGLVGYSGNLIVLKADRVHEQIGEVMETLSMRPDPKDRMTLCLCCNGKLREASHADVEGMVPAFIYQNCACFRKCPICERVYWPGTHPRHVEEFLRMRIPTHRP